MEFMGTERRVTKQKLIEYKDWLAQRYALSSANSMLVALNQFLDLVWAAGRSGALKCSPSVSGLRKKK